MTGCSLKGISVVRRLFAKKSSMSGSSPALAILILLRQSRRVSDRWSWAEKMHLGALRKYRD